MPTTTSKTKSKTAPKKGSSEKTPSESKTDKKTEKTVSVEKPHAAAHTPTDPTQSCACGSGLTLTACCLPIIQGTAPAKTAQDLMRARYTAFTLAEVPFILSSHHSKTRHQVKEEDIKEWSESSTWLGLTILQTEKGTAEDLTGAVYFTARYIQNGEEQNHSEKGLFEKENGQWRFLDAQGLHLGTYKRSEPKTGRNDPCPCKSGKKFKKCCQLNATV